MKFQPRATEALEMPETSYGECKNKHHRLIIMADLANGFCIECWDRGKGIIKLPEQMRKNFIKD